jgi:putative endonuclease
MGWVVYILKCADDTLYTGITNDIERRLQLHSAGKGAKYTKGRAPLLLVHSEAFDSKSLAARRESEIKSLPRIAKLALAGLN